MFFASPRGWGKANTYTYTVGAFFERPRTNTVRPYGYVIKFRMSARVFALSPATQELSLRASLFIASHSGRGGTVR